MMLAAFMGRTNRLPDEEARELRPAVVRTVACILHAPADHEDVQDAANETMRRAFEKRDAAEGELRPYAMGIARHVALDLIRAKKRERARTADDAPPSSESSSSLIDRIPEDREPIDDAVSRTEALRNVRRALLSLDPGPRRAVELFHLEGKSYREISAALDVPVGTVATWVMRGRNSLLLAVGERGT
jgi:RNA polymerase sigma-70 factor (ECF subfamily)